MDANVVKYTLPHLTITANNIDNVTMVAKELKKTDAKVFTLVIESSLKKWDEFRKTDEYKDSWEY